MLADATRTVVVFMKASCWQSRRFFTPKIGASRLARPTEQLKQIRDNQDNARKGAILSFFFRLPVGTAPAAPAPRAPRSARSGPARAFWGRRGGCPGNRHSETPLPDK
ncbi:hypothetical protein MASR1M49_33060 [Pararhodobacter aggregans]